MSSNIARLGSAIRERRLELDLSQSEVATNGGPSDTTLSKIENGQTESVSRATLRRLDAALHWNPGSARAVYEGTGEAHPVEPGTISVGVAPETRDSPAWNTRRPEGISDEEHRRIVREAEDYYRWRIAQALGND